MDTIFQIGFGFGFGIILSIIIFGKSLYDCQQALKNPKHCADVCADQLLRFENKGLITIHCQKCTTKGSDNE